MLKITIQNTSDVVLLRLEGSIKGPWVDVLRKAWLASANMVANAAVSADLSAVTFADAAGNTLLLRMRKEGVVLTGASNFLRQMLNEGGENVKRSVKAGVQK